MRFIGSGLVGFSLLIGMALCFGDTPSDILPVITQNTPPAFSTNIQAVKVDKLPSVVVPQIGVLEEIPRAPESKRDYDTGGVPIIIGNPNGSSGSRIVKNEETMEKNMAKGILVPVVSVVDPNAPKKAIQQLNPLIALLPAPPDTSSPLPAIINDDDQRPIRRRSVAPNDHEETMDVAEDIVFRPLFRIRQQPRVRKYESRNYRPYYRPYNVNGYYRLPYDY